MFQSFIVGEVEHLFEEVDPEDGLHRPVGTAVVHAVHGSKALLVNQGERLVSENLSPTSLQALSLLRRHQELGLPEALLRVSYSEHPPLPRPGAAPTTFYYIIPTLPQAGEGFLRTNQTWLIDRPYLHVHAVAHLAGGCRSIFDKGRFSELLAPFNSSTGPSNSGGICLNSPCEAFSLSKPYASLSSLTHIPTGASRPPPSPSSGRLRATK